MEWIGGTPVFRECSVNRAARPSGQVRVHYTPNSDVYCYQAVIDVVVDASGRPVPSSVKTVRTNEPGYLQALIASLGERRYEPAQLDGRNVPQIVRINVGMAGGVTVVRDGAPMPRAPRRSPC